MLQVSVATSAKIFKKEKFKFKKLKKLCCRAASQPRETDSGSVADSESEKVSDQVADHNRKKCRKSIFKQIQ